MHQSIKSQTFQIQIPSSVTYKNFKNQFMLNLATLIEFILHFVELEVLELRR